ncbi:DUF3515 domain-containing protein [Streptomyces sp. NPDC057877]|uniref:DUF3515 domain-containing protein n=1 Tax=Streptomyces sp. NPDC057877 TaxID=3346269 RepID=UPI0036ABAD41
MKFFRHRRPLVIGPPALAALIGVAGCSSSDDSAVTAVPSPGAEVTKVCQNLDKALPREVAGLERRDPEPPSALTAGWGNPAIILRCGVVRPPMMTDPKAVAGGVNGVDWLQEAADDGAFRFTTANRVAYVEVTVAEGSDSSGALVDLAPAVKQAIPAGIAD